MRPGIFLAGAYSSSHIPASTRGAAVEQAHKCGNCGNNPFKTSDIPCSKDLERLARVEMAEMIAEFKECDGRNGQ